jgi:hypothetical protein
MTEYTYEERDAFILANYNQPGWTSEKIAAHLGLASKNCVINRWHRMKGAKKKRSDYVKLSDRLDYEESKPAVPSMPKLRFLGEK